MDTGDCSSEVLFSCDKQLWQSLGNQFKSIFFLFNFGEKSRTLASQEVLGVTLFANTSGCIKLKFTSSQLLPEYTMNREEIYLNL